MHAPLSALNNSTNPTIERVRGYSVGPVNKGAGIKTKLNRKRRTLSALFWLALNIFIFSILFNNLKV